jgi:hypothetical protein
MVDLALVAMALDDGIHRARHPRGASRKGLYWPHTSCLQNCWRHIPDDRTIAATMAVVPRHDGTCVETRLSVFKGVETHSASSG